MKAIVFDIQRFSLHDGPGIRTTVFLKGCPLRCLWCHNPEAMRSDPQLAITASRCLGCGECEKACPNGVHSLVAGQHLLDRRRCRACGSCVEVCYAEALEIVGREQTLEQVLAEVEKDRAFYEASGGGVTVSGGEPLQQAQFTRSFLKAARKRGLHTVLDTSGYAQPETFLDVAREADLVLFDLKHTDDVRHRELAGVSNQPILGNLRSLAREGIPFRVRVPVIPGCNDEETNYETMAALLRQLDYQPPVDLLPYHQLGTAKHDKLGTRYTLGEVVPPSTERLESIARLLSSYGLRVQVGG